MEELAAKMRIVSTVADVRRAVTEAQRAGDTIGFVPTMGALHEGHLSLVDASQAECDRTVVSIFVNPTQFGPGEDKDRYPRTLDHDCDLLAQRGCSLLFAPEAHEVYPSGHETFVEVGSLAQSLEGEIRPGHFRGVATVVLKLFQMVPAERAYFGRKDYQQSLVVERMIADFNLPIELVVCPTVREADGLAMSSRNAYLSPVERQQAASLWNTLQLADSLYKQGESNTGRIADRMRAQLAEAGITHIDYIAFLRPGTMDPVATLAGPIVVALAVRLGQSRLIDNHTIG